MKLSSSTTTTTTSAWNHLATMESLALPQELLWDGKVEPSSPTDANDELFSILAPYDDNLANDLIILPEDNDIELKPGLFDAEQLEDLFISQEFVIELCNLKEEHWNDPKLLESPTTATTALSTLFDCSSIGSGLTPAFTISKVQSPYENIESNISSSSTYYTESTLTQLTPPQSPPQDGAAPIHQANIINTGEQTCPNNLHTPGIYTVWTASPVASSLDNHDASTISSNTLAMPPSPYNVDADMIARETQIVDEILMHRVKELPEWFDDIDNNTQSSLDSSLTPSQIDTGDLCSMIADEDDEYQPDSSYATSSSSSSSSAGSSPAHSSINGDDQGSDGPSVQNSSKKRTRPYGRGVEDRKIRKKEQNKNAATRYRQKKKIQMEIVFNEEQKLQQRTEELKRTLAERNNEIKYLISLVREFYKDKK